MSAPEENTSAPPEENTSAPPVEEKKKRGKPKDEHAPPKPRNPYSRFAGEIRGKLKEERPELASDLAGMLKAITEEWAKVPDDEKAKRTTEYEKDMEIWRPKWEAYKMTDNYKQFVEVKTDYLDKKAQKKLVKTMNKEAPKKPKSGYMIFASSVRDQVMEKVKAEGLGLGDAGRLISEKWNALSEAEKAKYGEESQKMKIEFDVKDREYKQTEAFATFCDTKNKLVSTQQLKKISRTLLGDAPKSAASAYALFRSETMPDIVAANKDKKEGEKLSVGEIGAKLSEMWKNVPEEKKAKYEEEAAKLKEAVALKKEEFKKNKKYTDFLEQRQKIKQRENLLVNLREMPRRPKSTFALFAQEHKSEVEPGKGEGKGVSALKDKFANASAEEKAKFEAKNAEMTEQWKKEVETFKSSVKYQTFEATQKKIREEFANEAIKVTTLKFLKDAPTAPPKTGFSIFVGEKRKAAGNAGQKKSLQAKREEVAEAEKEWKKFKKEVKDEYEEKRKEMLKAYEQEIKDFMAGEKWQEYQKEAKRCKIPIRSLLFHKKKIVQKLKDGKPNPNSIELPPKPESHPSKPQNAMQMFTAEKKSTVATVSQIGEMWTNLSAEEKAEWDQKAAESQKAHDEAMEEFRTSEEGKTYFKELATAMRRRKMMAAKNKFLDDLPKKPASALYVYMKGNAKSVQKANPEAKGFEIKKILSDKWTQLSEDERKPLEEAAEQKMQEYNTKMDEFKASANYKAYVKATRAGSFVKKMQAKKKGKGKKVVAKAPTGPPVPESMPKRPANAFIAYMKAEGAAGRGAALPEMTKRFAALSPEEKKTLLEEAETRAKAFKEEMDAWDKSAEGSKYRKAVKVFTKSKKLKELKEKYCKDEPKRGQSAFFLFIAGTRQKVVAENPELKGLGPVQTKLAQMWKDLTAEERQPWLDKEKEEQAVYEEKLSAWHSTEEYKKYRKLSNALSGASSKDKKDKKDKKNKRPQVVMPEVPANMPVAPKSGFHIFGEETRKNGGPTSIRDVNKAWLELGAEGQKKYMEKNVELQKTYEEDMKAFQATIEGKKYIRLKAAAERKKKLSQAKMRFLGGESAPKEPKRPSSAYFLFLAEKSKEFKGDQKDRAKELTSMWGNLSPEDKAKYEDKAKELKDKYDEDLKAYKNSANYKAYERTLNVVTGKKAKEIARAQAKKAAVEKARAKAQQAAAKSAKSAKTTPAASAGGAAPTPAKADADSDEMGSDSSSSSSSKKSSSSSKSNKSSDSD